LERVPQASQGTRVEGYSADHLGCLHWAGRERGITEPWFAANTEIGLQVVLLGCSIQEVPISWMNRTFDMGHSSFKVLKFGTGYVRVLWRFARATRFGHRPLSKTAPVRA
jgi:hypothetical protein